MEDFVLAVKDKYCIGDLLWSKIGSYPYWPCMVSYDPKEGCYFKIKKGKKEVTIYHVQYFGAKVNHGWTTPGRILPYEGLDKLLDLQVHAFINAPNRTLGIQQRDKYHVKEKLHPEWYFACREADMALKYDTTNRYKTFVFKYGHPSLPAVTGTKKRKRHGNCKSGLKSAINKVTIASKVDGDLCKLCERGDTDLICTGDCSLSYHKECLGLLQVPKEEFKCWDCENGIFCCFVCKKQDSSGTRCSKCIYSYHDECLKKIPCANFHKKVCPIHVCLTCFKEHPRNISNKGPFVQCFRCPTMFHASEVCLPVGSVMLNPSYIICPDHFSGKSKVSPQPMYNVDYCSLCSEGGKLICCESCPSSYHVTCLNRDVPVGDFICDDCIKRQFFYVGMIVWAKTGTFRWWPAQIISENALPENIKNKEHFNGEFPIQFFGTDEYYWTHKGRIIPYAEHHKSMSHSSTKVCKIDSRYKLSLEEAAEAYGNYIIERQKQKPNKPDKYKPIKVNRFVFPVPIPTVDSSSILPCTCDPREPNPCGIGSKCVNRTVLTECHPELCLARAKCENQKFHRREYASVRVMNTIERGWGLKAAEDIPKGTFVIEYVGEIITHEEYRKRRIQMQEENNHNFYFLYLDAKRMLDAGPKGNLSRFINHSCNPNCEMEKWSVNGDVRVGIFAIRDIVEHEELTFNYQSDSIDFEQKCLCGSSNCQGVIGRNVTKAVQKKRKVK